MRRRLVSAIAVSLLAIGPTAWAQSIFTVAGGGRLDGKNAREITFEAGALAVDANGAVYAASPGENIVHRIDPATFVLSTAVGTGTFGRTGDGGPAIEAQLEQAGFIEIFGNRLLVQQPTSIRDVDLDTGIIDTVFTGNGFPDNPVADFFFSYISSFYEGDDGSLYFADVGNSRIYKADPVARTITPIAGTGMLGYAGDGGPAIDATLGRPGSVVTVGDTLYFVDAVPNVVRAIDLESGLISTVAGNGTWGYSGDGGPATDAQLAIGYSEGKGAEFFPFQQLAADDDGNLYIAEFGNSRIRRVDALSGVISTVVGGGEEPVTYDPRPGTSVGTNVNCTVYDPTRSGLMICGSGGVTFYDLNSGAISQFAGGVEWEYGDGGPAENAIIFPVVAAAVASNRAVFVNDARSIRRVDPATGLISTISTGTVPEKMDVGPDGNVYYLQEGDNTVGFMDPITGQKTTIAGTGEVGSSPDGVAAIDAPLNLSANECCFDQHGLAIDSSGNVYFTEGGNNKVRMVEKSTGLLKTIAGDGQAASTGDDGPAVDASINYPTGLALGAAEQYLYIGETVVYRDPAPGTESYKVRRVDLGSGLITTIAGNGSQGDIFDDVPATASSVNPLDIAIDKNGNLLVIDYPSLRKVDLTTFMITTVAGSRGDTPPFGDNGPALDANLVGTNTIDVHEPTGDVFIADASSGRVRVIPACRASLTNPGLTFPSNGSSGIGTAPTLSWTTVDGAFGYDVYLDTNDASTLVVSDSKQTTFTFSNLTPGSVYNWKVVAKGDPYCPILVTSTSPVFSFTTAGGCAAPGSFSLTSPASGQIVSGGSATLQWAIAPGAGSYDVYFGASNPPPLATTTTSTSHTVSGLQPGAGYLWRIVARAACDSSLTTSSETRSFSTLGGNTCTPPGELTLSSPPDGASDVGLAVDLAWTESNRATSYDLFFGTTSPPALYLPGLTSTSQSISSLRSGTNYFWSVRARSSGCSSASFTTPIASFATQSACLTPGGPEILFSPPGAVSNGQTYVIVWASVNELEADGFYQVERSSDAAFLNNVESQLVEATAASFIASATGAFYHRVRAVPTCDVANAGPWSDTVTVTVADGAPNVVFTVQPPAVISSIGQALEDKRASFTLENIGEKSVEVIMTTARIASPDFFNVYDPQGSDGVFVTLEPRIPHTFDLKFSGPPNDQSGSYQGVIVVNVPGSPVIPYAFVNLKVGSDSGATPEILVGDRPASWVFFPGFSGSDDGTRQPLSIFVRNPGSTPMEVGAEIGPEAWLVPESGWNTQPIAPGALRELKLFTNRKRAPNGSPLPRYTYLTIRTRTGAAARILVQDNDEVATGEVRSRLEPDAPGYIVPDVVADHTHGIVSVIRLTNVGSDVVQATLYFTPRSSDGFSDSVRIASVLVPPNDVVALTDPLGLLFGVEGDAAGQIEVRAAREKIGLLSVASTLVDGERAELVLASIPTLWRGEGARLGARLLVPGVTSDATQRSELILAETLGNDRASVIVTLYDASGNVAGRRTLEVPRYGQSILPDIAAGMAGGADLTAARLEVAPADGGGAVVPLVKIIDRTTRATAILVGQPSTGSSSAKRAAMARMQKGGGRSPTNGSPVIYVVPFVTSGAYGASSATSTLLGLSSSLATPVDVSVTFRDGTSGQTTTQNVTLQPGASLEFLNVLSEIFELFGALRGTLTVIADPAVRVYSRSLAAPVGSSTAATSGQNAVVDLDSTLIAGASANLRRLLYLDGLNQSIDAGSGSRWSVFVSELTGQTAIVTVKLYEAGNRKFPIVTKDYTIPGHAILPLDTLFQKMDLETKQRKKNRANMICVIEPRGGAGVITAVAVEQSNVNATMRTHSFQPVAGTPATGTQLAIGNEAPERPGRKRPVRR